MSERGEYFAATVALHPDVAEAAAWVREPWLRGPSTNEQTGLRQRYKVRPGGAQQVDDGDRRYEFDVVVISRRYADQINARIEHSFFFATVDELIAARAR